MLKVYKINYSTDSMFRENHWDKFYVSVKNYQELQEIIEQFVFQEEEITNKKIQDKISKHLTHLLKSHWDFGNIEFYDIDDSVNDLCISVFPIVVANWKKEFFELNKKF
jgi:hypothetical protein